MTSFDAILLRISLSEGAVALRCNDEFARALPARGPGRPMGKGLTCA